MNRRVAQAYCVLTDTGRNRNHDYVFYARSRGLFTCGFFFPVFSSARNGHVSVYLWLHNGSLCIMLYNKYETHEGGNGVESTVRSRKSESPSLYYTVYGQRMFTTYHARY